MGFRTIKTAIAALMAVLIAEGVGIHGATSAGLLAILGVDVTRKRSLRTISARFFASVVGLLFACVLFVVFGFHDWVLALYILTAFPVIVRVGFKEGIVTGSVVVFRVFSGGVIDMEVLLTQLALLVIGLGSAMVVNLAYMPRSDNTMQQIRLEVDRTFSVIFRNMANTLRSPAYIWDGKEVIEADSVITKGVTEAGRSLENQMLRPQEGWNVYFYMRKEQLDSIQNMMQLIAQMYQHMPQAKLLAELFDQLSNDVLAGHYTGQTEKLLEQVREEFKAMELPATREEFEIRSALLQLTHELHQYLKIAKKDKAPTPVKN
ncbi:aromatic acid exporter family protein [Paenibacillus polymyxa]|uniref:aromatic acid exporter family protein n=1 Tax=Paenibacillus polymyxa TaxID=1406 RepID=UPI000EC17CE2|nr:aromatic acid exporter family protein [Paenibacillus polymyxa]RGL36136.1 aromatic acid exporter family protein [Paenibacillus polymyxa]UMR33739.1 aromatic acid exporter family protein [Paenibacillus polymyxa]